MVPTWYTCIHGYRGYTMQVTQSYAKPSRATMDNSGLHLDVSAELSRPGVRLDAQVKDSLAYARVMLALYEVVSSDFRAKPKDHTVYQEWVQQRYLEELSVEMGARLRQMPTLQARRDMLKESLKDIRAKIRPLEAKV